MILVCIKAQHPKNICKRLLRNSKKYFFENLDTKKITEQRSCWRTAQPLFTQNLFKRGKINLVDDGKTIFSDEELCETFNQFFSNVVPSLNMPRPKSFLMASENLDPILSVIQSFDKHPNIIKIKTKALDSNFHFSKTS